MRAEFFRSIEQHQTLFGLDLSDEQIGRLSDYYELIEQNNSLLHLVAPCPPDAFATRHILESLTLLEFLPQNTRFADVGPGAGLPSIPCLLVRDDLKADLIESKVKKSAFLKTALQELSLADRTTVINRQFEETEPGYATTVTCRALDKFTEKLPGLIKWSKKRQLLLFGNAELKTQIQKYRKIIDERLMPLSERRYLYVV